MKGNVKRLFIMAFVLMVLMPLNIYAIDLTQEDFTAAKAGDTSKGITYSATFKTFDFSSGEYVFQEDIDLEDNSIFAGEGEVTFDLNSKTISNTNSTKYSFVMYYEAKALIKGNGIVDSVNTINVVNNANLTIENGTFNGNLTVSSDLDDYRPTMIIKNGTFKGGITNYAATLTIEDGSFITNDDVENTIYAYDDAIISINGGTFSSKISSLLVQNDGFDRINQSVTINGGTFVSEEDECIRIYDTDKLEINGGSFTGYNAGLSFGNVNEIKLKGGLFKATGDEGVGIYTLGDSEELLTDILAEGYVYEPELKSTVKEIETKKYISTQKEIRVINASENDYKFLEGENAEYTIGIDNDLTFKINAYYFLFENGGKVYVDDELVESSNYTSLSGSTVIKLKKEYVSSLKEGKHSFKVVFNNGKEASTNFTVKVQTNDTANNPQTSDNILMYVSIMLVSFMGLGSLIYKMKKEN